MPQQDRLDCAIVTFYFPPCLGGLEYYLERLAAALSEKISVAVLAPKIAGCEEADARLHFAVRRRFMFADSIFARESLFKPLYPFVCMAIFYATLAEFWSRKPKVICSGSADFAWPVALAAALLGSEFTFICHGKDGHINPGLFSFLAKRLPLVWSMRRCRICFANSRFTARLLDPNGRFTEKIKILRVPIDKMRSSATTEENLLRARRIIWGDSESDSNKNLGPIILSVGRLRRHKGFQHVIAALPALASEFPGVRYVIVGSGPYEPELRAEAAKPGVESRVIFAGAQRPPDPFFSLADVFVTVTWDVADEPEGFGMVFIEAACFGLPSVAGNIGGMPEAVLDGRTGFCVPGESPAAIADALGKLLRDENLRRQMGEAARQYAAEFEPSKNAAQFIQDCRL